MAGIDPSATRLIKVRLEMGILASKSGTLSKPGRSVVLLASEFSASAGFLFFICATLRYVALHYYGQKAIRFLSMRQRLNVLGDLL